MHLERLVSASNAPILFRRTIYEPMGKFITFNYYVGEGT